MNSFRASALTLCLFTLPLVGCAEDKVPAPPDAEGRANRDATPEQDVSSPESATETTSESSADVGPSDADTEQERSDAALSTDAAPSTDADLSADVDLSTDASMRGDLEDAEASADTAESQDSGAPEDTSSGESPSDTTGPSDTTSPSDTNQGDAPCDALEACGDSCAACAEDEQCVEGECLPCNADCAGDCNGSATLDCAGDCNGSATLDCAGDCNGSATLDCAGDCNGSATLDCAGDCNGSATLNACGECTDELVEVCDGVDNDCDGFTDEGLGSTCTAGKAPIDYASYVRTPGVGFTPQPEAIPIPTARCASMTPHPLPAPDGTCMVPGGSCAVLAPGEALHCEGTLMVEGLLWIQSTEGAGKTLLVTDSVHVMEGGEFYVTGTNPGEPAADAELFLTHSYCGKPEDDSEPPDEATLACRARGQLMSMGGLVKIAGQAKTSWSLLTEDSQQTHLSAPKSIRVDDCQHWRIGDELTIAATGGDALDWHSAIAQPGCPEADCSPAFNFKAESRQIASILTEASGTCLVELDSALRVNHRGDPQPEGSPIPRLQAEVMNRTRSVLITGGYLEDPEDLSSRVQTAYDYASDGTPMASFGQNNEPTPCRTCAAPSPGCHDPGQCTPYDVGDKENDQNPIKEFCGPGCSTLGAQGITTMQMWGGSMQISHAEIADCGRRELAAYCLHFHHLGDVEHLVSSGQASHASYIIGNAVERGINKGITVHGTHRALVQHNVVLNQRGPGVYIEDGNELFNVIEENVIICSELSAAGQIGGIHRNSLCRIKNVSNRYQTKDSDYDEVSGLYFLAPANHAIGNRVSGYDNGMYVNVNTSGHTGLGQAEGKICPTAMPFGRTIGNVFHNNAGFGWYANKAYPQDMLALGGLITDPDGATGLVADWSLCLPYAESGADQSFNVRVERHLEYFNDFSAGVYDMGDVTMEDYTVYGSNKGLYWKTYRRGLNSGPLCESCSFIRTGVEAPGGSGHVAFEDSTFYFHGGNDIQLNHHCNVDNDTGGLFASHFDFRSGTFFAHDPPTDTYLPSHPTFRSGKLPTASLVYLDGERTLLHQSEVAESVAFDLDAEVNAGRCAQANAFFSQEGWFVCDDTLPGAAGDAPLNLRIVRIYSPDRGDLTLTNHDEGDMTYTIPYIQHGQQNGGATKMGYVPQCSGPGCSNYMQTSGYVFVIPGGSEFSLSFGELLGDEAPLYDLLALEYSEPQMTPSTEVTIRSLSGTSLMDSDTPCVIASTHDRAFITPYGAVSAAAGALYNECQLAWPIAHPYTTFIEAAYQGSDAPPPTDPVDPPEPSESAPQSAPPGDAEGHPAPEEVLSLYSWLFSDALTEAEGAIDWFPAWSPQSSYDFNFEDGSAFSESDTRVLEIVLPQGVDYVGLFEFPRSTPAPR